ncbi:MAG: hypothetical protein ACE5JL_07295, partial [Dehalococcoidia bacterium]
DRPHPGPFNWHLIEPDYDRRYNWTHTDRYVDTAQNYGFATVATIWPFNHHDQMVCNSARPAAGGFVFKELPRWLYLPCNMEAYQAFVRAMVERYDGDGMDDYPNLSYPIKYWEVANEPEMQGPELTFFLGTPEEYAEIVRATYEAVKGADARAKVIQGGAAGLLDRRMREFWEAVFSVPGIGDYFDIANVHSISGSPNLFVPEFKELLGAHGLDDKPLWVTEASISTDPTPASEGRALTEEEKGQALKQSFRAAFAAGAEKVFYTTLYGYGDPQMVKEALVRPDGTPLPAFHAFVEMIEETTTVATPAPPAASGSVAR